MSYVFTNLHVSKHPHIGKKHSYRVIGKLHGIKPGQEEAVANFVAYIEYFTVHDLRGTNRSLFASMSVHPYVAERCLNHNLKGAEGIYDRHDYFEEIVKAHY